MAVPKQKQSHSRTHKRRAQHKISAPTYNACPQ
ncbi:MAG: Ribosomal L32p protein family, partial [bacterium]